jgi:hypothetical protein
MVFVSWESDRMKGNNGKCTPNNAPAGLEMTPLISEIENSRAIRNIKELAAPMRMEATMARGACISG